MGFSENQALKNELKQFDPRRAVVVVLVIILAAYIVSKFMPDNVEDFGPLCTIPAIFLIVYILFTKRIIEALALGSVVGFILCAKSAGNPLITFSTALTGVMMEEDTGWQLIVVGSMGGLIALIGKSGGVQAFGRWAATKAKTARLTMFYTMILGMVVFIDEFLNVMTIGTCMAPLSDNNKIPREKLAYIADSTGSPTCVLVPISTWSVFIGGLLVSNGYSVNDSEVSTFITLIPFQFYAWAALIIVALVVIGAMPNIGPMRKAYKRVAEGGPLAPEGSEKISILSIDHEDKEIEEESPANSRIINFFAPLIILVAATVLAGNDMQIGILITMLCTFVLYMWQRLMDPIDFWDTYVEGLQNLVMPLLLVVLSFTFASMNETIGFTQWCIDTAALYMSPATAPVLIFLVLGASEFICGSSWGMFAIAIPIVVPLAMKLGVSVPLASAACISAGVFGSHICFYADATILASASTGCDNFRHALSQLPYGLIAAGLAAIAFLVTGIAMA